MFDQTLQDIRVIAYSCVFEHTIGLFCPPYLGTEMQFVQETASHLACCEFDPTLPVGSSTSDGLLKTVFDSDKMPRGKKELTQFAKLSIPVENRDNIGAGGEAAVEPEYPLQERPVQRPYTCERLHNGGFLISNNKTNKLSFASPSVVGGLTLFSYMDCTNTDEAAPQAVYEVAPDFRAYQLPQPVQELRTAYADAHPGQYQPSYFQPNHLGCPPFRTLHVPPPSLQWLRPLLPVDHGRPHNKGFKPRAADRKQPRCPSKRRKSRHASTKPGTLETSTSKTAATAPTTASCSVDDKQNPKTSQTRSENAPTSRTQGECPQFNVSASRNTSESTNEIVEDAGLADDVQETSTSSASTRVSCRQFDTQFPVSLANPAPHGSGQVHTAPVRSA